MGDITVLNFTGAYERQDFYQDQKTRRLDLGDVPGTNCYCDGAARAHLMEAMEAVQNQGICFLDSGNYHYITRLRLEWIQEPFELLVLDHHTDMQPPAFGEILSCGGWIFEALKDLPLLRRVYLCGPPKSVDQEEGALIQGFGDRIRWLEEEELAAGLEQGELPWENPGLPLFLSIDRDVLSREWADTNWDQGTMSLELLLALVRSAQKRKILGADVCGENPEGDSWQQKKNALSNRRILEVLNVLLYGSKGERKVEKCIRHRSSDTTP